MSVHDSHLDKENIMSTTSKRYFGKAMTKSRYSVLDKELKNKLEAEKAEEILTFLRELFDFDPTVPSYSPEYGKKQIEKKKLEAIRQQKSSYELYCKQYRKKKIETETKTKTKAID